MISRKRSLYTVQLIQGRRAQVYDAMKKMTQANKQSRAHSEDRFAFLIYS
jgi:hypothetical protein